MWMMNRMDGGQWTPSSRLGYNLRDTVARCTVQVRKSLSLSIQLSIYIAYFEVCNICLGKYDDNIALPLIIMVGAFLELNVGNT